MQVPVSRLADDREAMKKYFMQSQVYQSFKDEQEQEMRNDEGCQASQEEFKELKAKFIDLSEKYNSLQEEVHAQTLKTNSLVQKINHSSLVQK